MREIIINTVKDLVSNFTYYDRKEDEDLSVEQLVYALNSGIITTDEIVQIFKETLESTYKP